MLLLLDPSWSFSTHEIHLKCVKYTLFLSCYSFCSFAYVKYVCSYVMTIWLVLVNVHGKRAQTGVPHIFCILHLWNTESCLALYLRVPSASWLDHSTISSYIILGMQKLALCIHRMTHSSPSDVNVVVVIAFIDKCVDLAIRRATINSQIQDMQHSL